MTYPLKTDVAAGLQVQSHIPPKSVQLSNQNSSVSSTVKTPMESHNVDPNEPKCIASFLLPYTVSRDSKNKNAFKVKLSISKHAILYGSLLQLLNKKEQNFKWVGVVQSVEPYSDQEKT